MVEEDGVQDLAAGLGQAEAHVGDPEDRPRLRQLRLDRPDPFDRLDGAADVLLVARAAGKDERIEDDVLRRDPVLLRQERVAAVRDLELALARDAHAVLRIFVDRPDDEGGAVLLRERNHRLESGLAVLQVDRVQDGLALAPLEPELHHLRVGRVEHERNLDHPRGPLQEGVHVGGLVPVRILEADVDDLGAALDLRARDLGGRVELPVGDQALELPAAEDVGALADENGPVVFRDLEGLDARHEDAVVDRRAARLPSRSGGRRERAMCGGVVPQQPPTMFSQPLLKEAGQLRRELLRRLRVPSVCVGQAGVGVAGDRRFRETATACAGGPS